MFINNNSCFSSFDKKNLTKMYALNQILKHDYSTSLKQPKILIYLYIMHYKDIAAKKV